MSKPESLNVCAAFMAPPDGLYGAYCHRCGFARHLHADAHKPAPNAHTARTTEADGGR